MANPGFLQMRGISKSYDGTQARWENHADKDPCWGSAPGCRRNPVGREAGRSEHTA
jgi:hypothetical protein